MTTKLKIGYLGKGWTYTYKAARRLYPNEDLRGYSTARDAFRALDSDQVDVAVLPVENSTSGPVIETLQLLAEQTDEVPIRIIKEHYERIEHYLFVRDERVSFESIKAIITKGIAKDQCEKFLNRNIPSYEFVHVATTDEGASNLSEWIKKNGKEAAAIGPEELGEEYNLHPLGEKIQDLKNNTTRFLVLSKKLRAEKSKKRKTTVAVVLHDRMGSLVNALGIISSNDFSIISLKTAPVRAPEQFTWKDWFFIDAAIDDGRMMEMRECQEQLSESEDVLHFKPLGVYPNSRVSKQDLLNEIFTDIQPDFAEARMPHKDIKQIIAEGEGTTIEFKSSLRWDYNKKKVNPKLGLEICKAASAMMNTAGGVILIGVDDNGLIIGLEQDFHSWAGNKKDKFNRMLSQMHSDSIGKENAVHVIPTWDEIEEKTICRINIPTSNYPIYFRSGIEREFYIRIGASNRRLDIEEANSYITKHW